MVDCIFKETGRGQGGKLEIRCDECGTTLLVAPQHRSIRANCRKRRAHDGVGTQLQRLITKIGFSATVRPCDCNEMIARMNAWGPAGCLEHRQEIVEHLKAAYSGLTWAEVAKAAAAAMSSGLVLRLNPLDLFGSLVDEAVRQAEATAQD